MATQARSSSAFRFGPFVLCKTTGELSKGSIPLKLHPQPFRLLVLLLERAGTLVTRGEIQRTLWGGHTWVDFDGGINFCIRRIRAVLGDDADTPKYIETVSRKGYRFIAEVIPDESMPLVLPISPVVPHLTAIPASGGSAETARVRPEGLIALPLSVAQEEGHAFKRNRLVWIGAAAGVLLFLAGVSVYYFTTHRSHKLTQIDTVVLADFRNTTGDPVFDGTLQQGLSAQLAQSSFLNLVSDAQIQQTLGMMKQSADAKLTPELAKEVCERTNGAAVLTGSIAQIGSQYDLVLKASSCSSVETLASVEAQASDKNHVLRALGEASGELRAKLGESLATVQKFDAPLVQATTPSLEALKAYSLGYAKFSRGDQAGAIPFFQRAIDIDPDFAMAYANMGRAYQVLGRGDRQVEALRKAYTLREHASGRERFDIVAAYHQFVTQQLDQSIQNCELWEQSYPRDFTPHRMLGFEYGVIGRYEQSTEEFRKAVELDPQQALPYAGLIIDLTALQRFDEVRAVYEQAKARHLESGEVERNRYMLAFLESDKDTTAKLAESLSREPNYGRRLIIEESSAASYFGHFVEARELFERAKSASLHDQNNHTAASMENYMGLREALVGNLSIASDHAGAASRLGEPSALVFALGGDIRGATKTIEPMASNTPPGSYDDKVMVPEAKGAIELERGHAKEALEFLQPLTFYESGWFDRYQAAYLRGNAYLLSHRGEEAAAEFRKIIDHPGIVINSEIAPLAHLGLGRAYVLAGKAAKARTAYQDFLALWIDADPDIPILKQAKEEYAKLP